jgi:Glycosyl transferase family 2
VKFTIGIPTYNRARILRRAIESALDQSWPDVEVLVSDDASTDGTAEVVRSFGERVRYHRNPQNIGNWPNFVRLAELASGEYFSWLQDDDVIHRDFVRRASEAFARSDDIVFYTCYAIYSRSSKSIKRWDTIHGPMIPADWMAGEPRVIEGLMAVPFCLFESIAISPAVAFRTSAIRRAARHVLEDCPLFNENLVTAAILSEGKAVIDPWVGAIQTLHSEQEHIRIGKDEDEILREILLFQRHLEHLMTTLPERWRGAFVQCLGEIPEEHRVFVMESFPVPPHKHREYWSSAPAIVREVRDLVLAGLPAEATRRVSWAWESSSPVRDGRVKRWLKRSVPARLWEIARLCRRALRHGVEIHVR